MLLAERLLLLLLDAERGHLHIAHPDTEADELCAGAVVIELAFQGRVELRGDRLHSVSGLPTSHPLLDQAAHLLVTALPVDDALKQLRRKLAPLTRELLDGLYRRDLVHRQRDWRFWDARRVRYPLRSLQGRNEALAVLREAVRLGAQGNHAALALPMLADIAGVLAEHLDAAQYNAVEAALLHLNGAPRSGSPVDVLVAVRQALLA